MISADIGTGGDRALPVVHEFAHAGSIRPATWRLFEFLCAALPTGEGPVATEFILDWCHPITRERIHAELAALAEAGLIAVTKATAPKPRRIRLQARVARYPEELEPVRMRARRGGAKRRNCLSCGNRFDSEGPHERVCPNCKSLSAWSSGADCIMEAGL